MSEIDRIKKKIHEQDSKKWWGDDFDVRFYLISKIKNLKNKSVLDLGGGIGIICSEMDISNFRINMDSSFKDLKTCNYQEPKIQNICASMTHLPFDRNSFDCIICSHLLEVAKSLDIKNQKTEKNNDVTSYPTVEKTLEEIHRVMKDNADLYLTTPNNSRYKSTKLDYYELKKALQNHFPKFLLSFYNTYPRLSKQNRKFDLANIIPKLTSKLRNSDKIRQSLLKKDLGKEMNSVSFYVEASKNEDELK